MTSRARFSCAVRVLLSLENRFAENAQTARQDFGWSSRPQAGSARRAGSLSLFFPAFGVTVPVTCPSLNASPCQRKCDSRSTGALVSLDPTMNPSPALVQVGQVRGRQHARVGDHDHGLDPVPGLELPDDRQDRELLRLAPLEAADLEGEAVPVDEQPDHDLRVYPPFLAVADLPQGVLALGLEVQRRHVIQDQRDISAGPRMREAQLCDPVAVAAVRAAGQGAAHRLVAGRLAAQVRQDPPGVQDRGRLHDPGQDQVPEHLITQDVESQVTEDAVQGLEQHPRVRRHHRAPPPPGSRSGGNTASNSAGAGLPRHEPGPRRDRLDAQVERALGRIGQHLPRPIEEDPQLGLGVRRPHVLHDLPPSAVVLGDLHGRRPGCRPHPPNPRHSTEPRAPISASNQPPAPTSFQVSRLRSSLRS